MQFRSKLLNSFIVTRGVYAIGQQNDNHRPFKIHPERGACKSQMPDAALRKTLSATGAGSAGRIKPQRFIGSRQSFEKLMQQFLLKQPAAGSAVIGKQQRKQEAVYIGDN